MFCVRKKHTPLNPIHFNPTSLINSAICTLSLGGLELLATLNRAAIDSGEFIVIVAAVDSASHDGLPSFRAVASCAILEYIDSMLRGAGIGPGRECAALMRALRLGDNFDMIIISVWKVFGVLEICVRRN